jgi:hypothetical protein
MFVEMDIWRRGVLFVVLGHGLTNVQWTGDLIFWSARDSLIFLFMVANTSDGCR